METNSREISKDFEKDEVTGVKYCERAMVLPNEVIMNRELTDGAKLLFAYILDMTALYGECVATNDHLAEKRNVTNATARRWLRELEKIGYITKETIIYELEEGNEMTNLKIKRRVLKPSGQFFNDAYIREWKKANPKLKAFDTQNK